MDKNGKKSYRQLYGLRPYLVLVIDTHNDYPIGWALGDREDFSLIKQAVKHAIDHTKELTGGYLRPAQVQSDNFSRKQLSGLLSQLCWHRYTPAAVGNAKAKPIERVFGYLGRRYLQMLTNFKGHNLTACAQNCSPMRSTNSSRNAISQTATRPSSNWRPYCNSTARRRARPTCPLCNPCLRRSVTNSSAVNIYRCWVCLPAYAPEGGTGYWLHFGTHLPLV